MAAVAVFAAAAAMFAGATVKPAHAQSGVNLMPDNDITSEEKARRKQVEDAYRAKLRAIPDAKDNDPWGGVRSPAKPTAKATPAPAGRNVDWGALNGSPKR